MPDKKELKRLAELAKKKRKLFLLQQRLSTDATLPSMGRPAVRRRPKADIESKKEPSRISRSKKLTKRRLTSGSGNNLDLSLVKSPGSSKITKRSASGSSLIASTDVKNSKRSPSLHGVAVIRRSQPSKYKDGITNISEVQFSNSRDTGPKIGKLKGRKSHDSILVSKMSEQLIGPSTVSSRDNSPNTRASKSSVPKEEIKISAVLDSSSSTFKDTTTNSDRKSNDASPKECKKNPIKIKGGKTQSSKSKDASPHVVKPESSNSVDAVSNIGIKGSKTRDATSKTCRVITQNIVDENPVTISSVDAKNKTTGLTECEIDFLRVIPLRHSESKSFISNISDLADQHSKSNEASPEVISMSDSHTLMLLKPCIPAKVASVCPKIEEGTQDRKKCGRKKKLKRLIKPVSKVKSSFRKGRPKGSKNKTFIKSTIVRNRLRGATIENIHRNSTSKIQPRKRRLSGDYDLIDERQLKKDMRNEIQSIHLEQKEHDDAIKDTKTFQTEKDPIYETSEVSGNPDSQEDVSEPDQPQMVTEMTQCELMDDDYDSSNQTSSGVHASTSKSKMVKGVPFSLAIKYKPQVQSITEYLVKPNGDAIPVKSTECLSQAAEPRRESSIKNLAKSSLHTVTEVIVRPSGEITPVRMFTSTSDDLTITDTLQVSLKKPEKQSHKNLSKKKKKKDIFTYKHKRFNRKKIRKSNQGLPLKEKPAEVNNVNSSLPCRRESLSSNKAKMSLPLKESFTECSSSKINVDVSNISANWIPGTENMISKSGLSRHFSDLPTLVIGNLPEENADIPVLSPTEINFSTTREDIPSPLLNMPVLIKEQSPLSTQSVTSSEKRRGRPRIHPIKVHSGKPRGRPRKLNIGQPSEEVTTTNSTAQHMGIDDSVSEVVNEYGYPNIGESQVIDMQEINDQTVEDGVKDVMDLLINNICNEVEQPVFLTISNETSPSTKCIITEEPHKPRGRKVHKRRGRPKGWKSSQPKECTPKPSILNLQLPTSDSSIKWKLDHSANSGSPEGSTKLIFKRKRKVYKSMSERENSLFLAEVEQLIKEKEQADQRHSCKGKPGRARQFMLREKISRSPLEILAMKDKLEEEEYEKSQLSKRKYTKNKPKLLLPSVDNAGITTELASTIEEETKIEVYDETKEVIQYNGSVNEMLSYCKPCYVPVINLVPFMNKYLDMDQSEVEEFYYSSGEGEIAGSDRSYIQSEEEQTEDDSLEELTDELKNSVTAPRKVCDPPEIDHEDARATKLENVKEEGYIGSFVEFLKNSNSETIKPRIQRIAKVTPIVKTPVIILEASQKPSEPEPSTSGVSRINNTVSTSLEREISSSTTLEGVYIPVDSKNSTDTTNHQQSSSTADAAKPCDDRKASVKYHCKSCDFITPSKQIIENHIYTHLPKIVFKCGLCHVQFNKLVCVQSHIFSVHPNSNQQIIKVPSVKEDEYYRTDETSANKPVIISLVVQGNLSLNTSMSIVHNPTTRFVCTHCQYSTNVMNDISQHVLDLHKENELFICTLCDRSLYHSKEEMVNHCRSTHPSRPDCFRKLPNFYDCEQLAEGGERGRFDGRENIFERMTTFLNPSQSEDGQGEDTARMKRAREYLNIQDALKNKTSAEADSTTAWDTPIEESSTEEVRVASDSVNVVLVEDVPQLNTSSVLPILPQKKTCVEENKATSDVIPPTTEPEQKPMDEEGKSSVNHNDGAAEKLIIDIDSDTNMEKFEKLSIISVAQSGSVELGLNDCIVESAPNPPTTTEKTCLSPEAVIKTAPFVKAPENQETPTDDQSSVSGSNTDKVEQDTVIQATIHVCLSPESNTVENPVILNSPVEEIMVIPASDPEAVDGDNLHENTSICESIEEGNGLGQLKIVSVVSLHGQELSPEKPPPSPNKMTPPPVSTTPDKGTSIPHKTVNVDDIVMRNQRLTCTYKCKVCNVHAPFLSVIVEHLVSNHQSICVFTCPYCKISEGKKPDFKTEADVRQHIKRFHPSYFAKKDTSLSDSAKEFVQVVAIPSSMDTQRLGKTQGIERDIYMCQKCSAHMPSLDYMYSHIESEHLDVFLHVCPECKTFQHKSDKVVCKHIEQEHNKDSSNIELSMAMEDNIFVRVFSVSKNGIYNDKAVSVDKLSPKYGHAPSDRSETIKIRKDPVLKTSSCIASTDVKKRPTARKSIKRTDDIQRARQIMDLQAARLTPSTVPGGPRPIIGSQLFTDSTTDTTATVTSRTVAALVPIFSQNRQIQPSPITTAQQKIVPNILPNQSPRHVSLVKKCAAKTVAQQLRERYIERLIVKEPIKGVINSSCTSASQLTQKTVAQKLQGRLFHIDSSQCSTESSNETSTNMENTKTFSNIKREDQSSPELDPVRVQSRKFSMTDKLHRLGNKGPPFAANTKPVLNVPTLEQVRNIARPKSIGEETQAIDLTSHQDMSHYPGILRPPSAPIPNAMRPPKIIPSSSPELSISRSSNPSLLFPRGPSPNQQGAHIKPIFSKPKQESDELPPDAFKIFNLKPSKSPLPNVKSSSTPPVPNLMGPFPQQLLNVNSAFQMTQIPVAQIQQGVQGQTGQIPPISLAQGFPGLVFVQPQAFNIPTQNPNSAQDILSNQTSPQGDLELQMSGRNYACPYCLTVLDYHAVVPHIQLLHKGCTVYYKHLT